MLDAGSRPTPTAGRSPDVALPGSVPADLRIHSGRAFLAPITTDTVAGSKAEPISRLRGCALVGAAEMSTMKSIAQPQARNGTLPVRREKRLRLPCIGTEGN